MKLVHRIGCRINKAQRTELEELGVKLPKGLSMPGDGDPLVTFDVNENHENWPTLEAKIRKWGVSDIVRTEFTKKEISDASWLKLMADWHHGYPQPREDEFGYLEATYDLTTYCEKCGIGKKQNAPFQMKGEPKWGKRGILQLNWIFDEYFVTPDVWSSIFRPHGIECRPVLNTKGAELKTVVQLIANEVSIRTDDLLSEEAACVKCGRTKYMPVTRGRFPKLASEPSKAMVKTEEYFGSGASAHKEVLISQTIASALVAQKIGGASFGPVSES